MNKLIFLSIILTVLYGCETSRKDLMPTRSLDRSSDLSGKIHNVDLFNDVTHPFQFGKGETEYLLAGSLEDVEAGLFLKFPAIEDTLISGRITRAKLYLYSDEVQGPDEGVFTARLRGVTSYWNGTDSLETDSFMYEDLSIPTVEVTRYITNTETTLEEFEVTIFEIPKDYVESWIDSGAFYMDADGQGSLLRGYYSVDYEDGLPPDLLIMYDNGFGDEDSVLVQCLDDTYAIQTGRVFQEPLVVSEGTAYWVYVKFAIPDSIIRYTSVNRAILELPIIDRHLLDDSMILQVRLIEEQLTDYIKPTQSEDGLYKQVRVNSDSTEFHVEIKELVQKWVMWPDENYGIMIRGDYPFARYNAVSLGTNFRLELLISDIPEYQ